MGNRDRDVGQRREMYTNIRSINRECLTLMDLIHQGLWICQ